MSQEIIEGIQAIEKEKGIEEGVLITALEDALRAAYKKTPGATRHAEVQLDDVGEFRVFGIEIPEDIEIRLVEEAREARITELEQLEEETGSASTRSSRTRTSSSTGRRFRPSRSSART